MQYQRQNSIPNQLHNFNKHELYVNKNSEKNRQRRNSHDVRSTIISYNNAGLSNLMSEEQRNSNVCRNFFY